MLSLVESSSRISMVGELLNALQTICTQGAIEESGEKIERLKAVLAIQSCRKPRVELRCAFRRGGYAI